MRKPSACIHALACAAIVWSASLPAAGALPCPPAGWTEASLAELRANSFVGPDDAATAVLARGLPGCLADPRPDLRDGIAFEALSTWLRAGRLDTGTRRAMMETLLPMLAADRGQAPMPTNGFEAPFAALVLSEVARTDRIAAWMSDAELEVLVVGASGYLSGVEDRRGYDPVQGWRHGVAHGADFALQLGMNPRLSTSQLQRLLDAIAIQVAPKDGHSYVYGEPDRLARAVIEIARRGTLPPAVWNAWFARVSDPAPLQSWGEAYASPAGLSQRHDTLAFLRTLYVAANESANEALRALLPALREALGRVG